jgi:hypothetical protein
MSEENKSQPNPNWVTVTAKRKLELVIEFDGQLCSCGVLIDGAQTFGSESLDNKLSGHASVLKMAIHHLTTIFNQTVEEKTKRSC